MHFRNRLLVLVLSVLVPSFASGVLAVWYVYAQEHADQERSVSQSARALAMLVDKELQSREGVLNALSHSPALQSDNLSVFYGYAKSLAPTPDTTIVLHDASGRQLINTRVPYGQPLPQKRSSDAAELMAKYGSERTLVTDVFFAPIGQRYDFVVQVPVMQAGAVKYFLSMGINASTLQSLFEHQGFPQPWIITVVDRNGAVVVRTRDQAKFVGTLVRPYSRKILAAAREGVYQSVTLEGIPVKAFFSTIPRADWKMIISIPESEIRRIPISVAAMLAVLLVLLLAVAVLAARRTARRSIAPIDHLGDVADRLARGEPVAYAPLGLVEIDNVGMRLADAAAQIKAARSELERKVAVAVSTNERAQAALIKGQKLEALSRLTGGIAHDFNNLLQTLMSALQLAAMTTTQDRVRELVATCQAAVNRAVDLTQQLSSFGKAQQARLETVDLRAAIQKQLPLLGSAMGSSVTLRVDIADDLWPVLVDPAQLELALVNIALNARDAMPRGGAFRLTADNVPAAEARPDMQGDVVLLRLTDTGAGMSAHVLANALDPFFTTKALGQANGLGLAQVYGFVNQSGGTVRLDSVEGEGTVVELTLPRAVPLTKLAPGESKAAARPAPRARTVLFVDDDALLRDTLAPALEHAGFTVALAESGDQAWAMLEAGLRPDVVFSDIVMPGQINGIALAGAVRERYPQMGIVLATGYSDKRIGIPDIPVLSKPYQLTAAIDTLNAQCGRSGVAV